MKTLVHTVVLLGRVVLMVVCAQVTREKLGPEANTISSIFYSSESSV